MLSRLNVHARHMACRSNVSPRTPFPTLITRELLNDNVNIDHSSAKHWSTVWLVGLAQGEHPMIFFKKRKNFPLPRFIPFCVSGKSSDSAVFSSCLFLPHFHLLYIPFNFYPVASFLSSLGLLPVMVLHGCEHALLCQPGRRAAFSQQIIAQ